jgi:hypothetical protein
MAVGMIPQSIGCNHASKTARLRLESLGLTRYDRRMGGPTGVISTLDIAAMKRRMP